MSNHILGRQLHEVDICRVLSMVEEEATVWVQGDTTDSGSWFPLSWFREITYSYEGKNYGCSGKIHLNGSERHLNSCHCILGINVHCYSYVQNRMYTKVQKVMIMKKFMSRIWQLLHCCRGYVDDLGSIWFYVSRNVIYANAIFYEHIH